jgi:HEAT repeat protein
LASVFSPEAWACGFHSSFLAKNIHPKNWWEYHKHEYVDEEESKPTVTGTGNLEPAFFKKKKKGHPSAERRSKRRALIAMVVRHMMYLNATNVMPGEFPDFRPNSVTGFIRSFKDILVELGPDAIPHILDAYLWMLFTEPTGKLGLTKNRQFKDDMIDVLMRIGTKSLASMSAYAAKCKSSRCVNAVIALMERILQRDPDLKGVPSLVHSALKNWSKGSGKLQKLFRAEKGSGPSRTLILHIWLGIAFEKGEHDAIVALVHDRDLEDFLRAQVIGFLARKEHTPAMPSFLKLMLDPEENIFVRRSSVMGIWELYLYCPKADMKTVKEEMGLKALITNTEENKTLRIVCIFLLANLEAAGLLDTLVLLLNREKEDEGVRLASIEGIEKLGLTTQAAGKLDKEVLLRRKAIAEVRFRLLKIVTSLNDKGVAPILVKILLSDTEYPPIRVKSLITLKMLNFSGFEDAEKIILERTKIAEELVAFVLDREIGALAKIGMLKDLEALFSLQCGGLGRAFLSPVLLEKTQEEKAFSQEVQEAVFRLFTKIKGKESIITLKKILENPNASPGIKTIIASWAGDQRVEELKRAVEKAHAAGKDALLRITTLDALEKLGKKVDAKAVGRILFTKSGGTAGPDVMRIGLRLAGRIGTDALWIAAQCVRPPSEGGWDVTEAALNVLGGRTTAARPWFSQIWSAYHKSELGDPECREAFLSCLLRLGPSKEICDFLMKRMELEVKRLPVNPSTPIGKEAEEGAWKTKEVIPPVHGLFLLHAYMEGNTKPPDLSKISSQPTRGYFPDPNANLLIKIRNWYNRERMRMPNK